MGKLTVFVIAALLATAFSGADASEKTQAGIPPQARKRRARPSRSRIRRRGCRYRSTLSGQVVWVGLALGEAFTQLQLEACCRAMQLSPV